MSSESRFRCYMNLMAFNSLPQSSSGPRGDFSQRLEVLCEAGFDGVQFADAATREELAACRSLNLGIAASGRVNTTEEANVLAERAVGDGFECATLHAGWGLEDDDEAGRLIEGVLQASQRWRIPLYVETHRATICQDMWRTVQFIQRFPEMRFNADFSHWYAGQEMVYGGFEKKLEFIQPVLDRVRFIHARVATPGCIQVPAPGPNGEQPLYVKHFRQLWIASFQGFLRAAGPGDHMCFTPELLAPDIYYARTFLNSAGLPAEESDRWEQSLLLKEIGRECFALAEAAAGK
ncbi:MAG: hypothetical protein M3Y57_15335 [Acidobacteriota bacterium]|nr:hypothetical protein [Acidobacteriota bacterium]